MQNRSIFHGLRVIAGCGLLGAVLAGTFFGWIGMAGVHEAGAALGVGLGIAAKVRNLA